MSVKEVGVNEPAIHGVHMAIDHVAGAVGVREVESQEKGVLFGAELFDRFKGCAADGLSGPSEEVSDLLTEVSRCLGMIDIPDGLLDGRKEGLQPILATVPDLDEGVQEAFDDHDGDKERSPSILGSLPAIGVLTITHKLGLLVHKIPGRGDILETLPTTPDRSDTGFTIGLATEEAAKLGNPAHSLTHGGHGVRQAS